MSEPPWTRSFAIRPQRMTDGRWVWLRFYEWRWRIAAHPQAPRAVTGDVEFRSRSKGFSLPF